MLRRPRRVLVPLARPLVGGLRLRTARHGSPRTARPTSTYNGDLRSTLRA